MTVEELRSEVEAWVTATWNPTLTLRQWWAALMAAGYAFPTWPDGLGGRGYSSAQGRVISDVLAAHGVIGPPSGNGAAMGAPTVLAHGTADQKERFVLPIANGTEAWCQLFSEPGAGSDLASLQTKAVRDGDEFIITGQKVWNSSADVAARGMLLARTNPEMPKHKGISYLMIDMRQPGIEVRPLRQMNGQAEFCEVFLDGARARVADVIGDIDDGWRIAQTTLGHERSSAASTASTKLVSVPAGDASGSLDRPVGELIAELKANPKPRRVLVLNTRSLIAAARDLGLTDDPVVRQRLAHYHCLSEVYRLTNLRARANARKPGPESSLAKLSLSRLAHATRDIALPLVGAGGMITGPGSVTDGIFQFATLSSFVTGIGGGTDEIQRNVVAERVLGLPKEPSVDNAVPFKDLKVGTQR